MSAPTFPISSVMLVCSLCACGNGSPTPVGPQGISSPPTTTQAASADTVTTAQPAVKPPPSVAPTAGAGASGSPEPAVPSGPPTLPSLPEGTTVLHVGDSMAQALAPDLARELRTRGIRSVLKVKEATYIPEWAGFKWAFAGMIEHYKPDLVIITLGGNEVAMPDPSIRAEPVRRMIATVGDRPCIWIKAPLWGPHTGVMDVIRDNCAPCRWVDTDKLLPNLERLGDGIHPTIVERRRWAKLMVRWLAHNLDPKGKHPFALKEKTTAPPADAEVPEVDESEYGKIVNIKAE